MSLEDEKKDRIKELDILIKPDSIYFAHPLNFFNTRKEVILEEKIKLFFPNYNIESPNQKHHKENYKFWKEKTGNGMDYFFNEVLPRMKAGIGLPFEDGFYSAGVFGELDYLFRRGKSIWEINHYKKIKNITDPETLRVLSIEETLKRIFPIVD